MGGIGVGFIEKTIATIDEGPTFLALAILAGVSGGFVVIERIWGPAWRTERLMRSQRRQDGGGDGGKERALS